MIRAIATFGFVGHLRPAPGTWGSLAAFPVAWAIHVAGGPWALLAVTVLLFFLGTWASERYMAETGAHDPSEVVVDEVVGQWIALLPVSIGAMHSGAAMVDLWPGILAAFVFFRAFDILKPGPVGWAETLPGGWGVMADDVVAGWIACLCVAVAAFVAHGVLGV
jgi:phosphatidylglycerophosphatase A